MATYLFELLMWAVASVAEGDEDLSRMGVIFAIAYLVGLVLMFGGFTFGSFMFGLFLWDTLHTL